MSQCQWNLERCFSREGDVCVDSRVTVSLTPPNHYAEDHTVIGSTHRRCPFPFPVTIMASFKKAELHTGITTQFKHCAGG